MLYRKIRKVREAAKKKVHPLVGGPLRGGGVVKAGPFCCHLKIKLFYFRQLSLSVGIFTWLLKYSPKNKAILVQKLWVEKKLSKSVFGYFKTKKNSKKKVPMAIKLEGGGVRP